jgi:transcriptional regulator with XRE-family HTH domain
VLDHAMSIADRLRHARQAAGFETIREFQRILPQDAPGTTYSSVSKYEQGIRTPSPEFLAAAAPILGVTEEWLASGQGPRTKGEQDTEVRRGQQPKSAVSDALWDLSEEVLDAYTQIPGPARRILQDLIFDLYFQRGPAAFDVPWEGTWRGYESAKAAFPEILVDAADVHRYLESQLREVLFEPPQATYGEQVAAWLAALSIVFLREFGSRR